jgi:hypothetical protein
MGKIGTNRALEGTVAGDKATIECVVERVLHSVFVVRERTGSTGLPFRVTVSDGARRMGQS